MRRGLLVCLFSAFLCGCAVRPGVVTQTKPVTELNAEQGVALKGYDAVAYFSRGAAVTGDKRFHHRWRGTTWHFVSEENRASFAASPEAFAPQFGGYCSFAMARGLIADIDPAAWAVVDGKLYLNNNAFAHQLWNAERAGNIAAANENWPLMPKIAAAEP